MKRYIIIAPKHTRNAHIKPAIRDTWAKSPPCKINPLEPYLELKTGDWPIFDHRDLLNWLDDMPCMPIVY